MGDAANEPLTVIITHAIRLAVAATTTRRRVTIAPR
jgi:hypothetical protein